jgi:hypothetical protein
MCIDDPRDRCKRCGGTLVIACPACEGKGGWNLRLGYTGGVTHKDCDTCKTTGRIPCPDCYDYHKERFERLLIPVMARNAATVAVEKAFGSETAKRTVSPHADGEMRTRPDGSCEFVWHGRQPGGGGHSVFVVVGSKDGKVQILDSGIHTYM